MTANDQFDRIASWAKHWPLLVAALLGTLIYFNFTAPL
jgi:hypothetical protein